MMTESYLKFTFSKYILLKLKIEDKNFIKERLSGGFAQRKVYLGCSKLHMNII